MKIQEPKLIDKRMTILITTAFIGGFMMTFFVSTLPLYAERMTGSAIYAGMVTTVFTIAALIARPISGNLCRKVDYITLLIIGFLLMVIACVSFRLATAINVFLVIRVIHGAGFGLKTTVSGVIVAEIIPKERFAEGIGIYNLYMPMTSALGPAIAYAIIGDGHDAGRFYILFMIGAVLGVIAIILSLVLKREVGPLVEERLVENADNKALPNAFLGFEKGVIWPSLVLACMYIGQGAIMSFLAVFAIDSGLGGVGRFFVINALALFFARLIYSKTVKRTGYDVPTVLGLFIYGIGLCIIPFAKSLAVLYLASVMMGSAQGIVPMAINTIILERCSVQRSGTAMAAYTSAMDIGIGVSSVLLGVILEFTGFKLLFIIAACGSFTALIIYLLTLLGDRKEIELFGNGIYE